MADQEIIESFQNNLLKDIQGTRDQEIIMALLLKELIQREITIGRFINSYCRFYWQWRGAYISSRLCLVNFLPHVIQMISTYSEHDNRDIITRLLKLNVTVKEPEIDKECENKLFTEMMEREGLDQLRASFELDKN